MQSDLNERWTTRGLIEKFAAVNPNWKVGIHGLNGKANPDVPVNILPIAESLQHARNI